MLQSCVCCAGGRVVVDFTVIETFSMECEPCHHDDPRKQYHPSTIIENASHRGNTMIIPTFRRCIISQAPRCAGTLSHNVLRGMSQQGVATLGSVRSNMYAPLKSIEADPDLIFDELDTDGDGFITKEEFRTALSRLSYGEVLKLHEAVHANLEAKLQAVENIERNMKDLNELYEKKKQAYHNVGFMTAAEIDALFDNSKMKKAEVAKNVDQLKGLIGKSRDLYGK